MNNNFPKNQSEKMGNRPSGAQARRYALAGVLLGLLFPVIATLIKIWQSHLSLNLSNIIGIQQSDALLWIIDTAPIFLGLLAGFAGIQQDNLIETRQILLDREEELKLIQTSLERRVEERTTQLSEKAKQRQSSSLVVGNIAEMWNSLRVRLILITIGLAIVPLMAVGGDRLLSPPWKQDEIKVNHDH